MVRYYVILDGRVQGVGCRFFCQMTANTYSLTGWVRNLDNGMVELEVQGDESSVSKFISTVIKGNRFIRVDDYHIKKKNVIPEEKSFITTY